MPTALTKRTDTSVVSVKHLTKEVKISAMSWRNIIEDPAAVNMHRYEKP